MAGIESSIKSALDTQKRNNEIFRQEVDFYLRGYTTPTEFLRLLTSEPGPAYANVVGPTLDQEYNLLTNTLHLTKSEEGQLTITDPFMDEQHEGKIYSVVPSVKNDRLVPDQVFELDDAGKVAPKLLDHKKGEDLQNGVIMLDFFQQSKVI